MTQLTIFGHACSTAAWQLYIDGAARNNPGPAGAGVYLLKEDVPVVKTGIYLGSKTNNQAEYLALLLGLLYARKHMQPHDTLIIKSDSELLVKQIKGLYSVKNESLKRLYAYTKELLLGLNYTIMHVLRGENKIADGLANKGIDTHAHVPDEFLTIWRTYEQASY